MSSGKSGGRKNKKPKADEVASADTVLADVDCIIKEKTAKTGAKSYLCTWMDGAEPQWLKEEDLEGTEALEEWRELEEEVPEEFDDERAVEQKCAKLVEWLRASKRPSWLVGAGLSASVLPTFRGRGGLWTRGRNNVAAPLPPAKKMKKEKSDGPDLLQPTFSHHALVSLESAGHVNWVASQNYDDLLLRAGFPADRLSELHGNLYMEVCDKCRHTYHRDFEVALPSAVDHETGRFCDQTMAGKGGEEHVCGGALKDNIIHFDEQLPWHELTMANAKFLGSDLTVVLGSSLRVEPAASLPFKAKRRRRRAEGVAPIRCVIVNLQPTPRDGEADLIIRARCDDVLTRVAAALGVQVGSA